MPTHTPLHTYPFTISNHISQGCLYSWGDDHYGCLGIAAEGVTAGEGGRYEGTDRSTPTRIESPKKGGASVIFRGVKSGENHCVAWTGMGGRECVCVYECVCVCVCMCVCVCVNVTLRADEGEIYSWGCGIRYRLGIKENAYDQPRMSSRTSLSLSPSFQ